MKQVFYVILFFFFLQDIDGQVGFFSQFQNSAVQINPSLAGASKTETIRLQFTSRWIDLSKENGYNTHQFAFDMPFKFKNGDRLGLGINRFQLNINASSSKINVSTFNLSYHKSLSKKKKHFLQLGLAVNRIKYTGNDPRILPHPNDLAYENQIDFKFGLSYLFETNNGYRLEAGIALDNPRYFRPIASTIFIPITYFPWIIHVNNEFTFEDLFSVRLKTQSIPYFNIWDTFVGTDVEFYLNRDQQKSLFSGWMLRIPLVDSFFIFSEELTNSIQYIGGVQFKNARLYFGWERIQGGDIEPQSAIEIGGEYLF